jgi:hypothetical protein
MKKIFFLFVVLLSISCSEEENNTPTAPVNDNFDPEQATLLKQGTWMGVGHSVSGTAKIYEENGKKIVVLDPFSSQNGPDLKIYLSKDENASQYINLGAMKSTMGKQSYDITGMPDLGEYRFVLVWCQEFSVLFGKVELE